MRIIRKKNPYFCKGIYTQKVEVKFLLNRIFLAYNRIALTAFAVFLLSFFVGTQDKEFFQCRLSFPPTNLDFQKFRLEG